MVATGNYEQQDITGIREQTLALFNSVRHYGLNQVPLLVKFYQKLRMGSWSGANPS